MTKLSVNVNKMATLRNARGQNAPDVVAMSKQILQWGAHGITIHPRPDERHIRKTDVYAIDQMIRQFKEDHPSSAVEFNIEGYPSNDFIAMIEEVRPDQVTLVPDPPEVLTSNAGWALEKNQTFLLETVERFKNAKVRVSLFIEPESFTPSELAALKKIAPERVELYTEAYAKSFQSESQNQVLSLYTNTANSCHQAGIELNAGHDLDQQNLATLINACPMLKEVSIGHALICEALVQGLPTTIGNYLRILDETSS